MKQPIFTPPISNCICGASASAIDWDFNDRWQVHCDRSCRWQFKYLGGQNNTSHRAICKWNNLMERTRKELENGKEKYLALLN